MFQLDLKSRKSIYQQVVDNMKDLILTGIIGAEEKLPSVRDLSKDLTVNPNTIQKAYRELEYEGYVYSVSGLGTFASKLEDLKIDSKKISEIELKLKNIINELFYLGLPIEEIEDMIHKTIKERGMTK